ncbi:microtubule-associated protein RP/EB family member 1-like [Drosophila willistoni]|uniref:microtubule-associated protein RP/EB family member 1-like n=1 Tax=Drosophila willistoni TaxID=7260 RepID=UPI00017D8853|nr:microtubule-associated protein RP/EB family member 1-like [Drosophila willistoni]
MSLKNVIESPYERYPPRTELLEWVNRTLKLCYTRLIDLRTGTAYCQLFHMLKPDAINMKMVKWTTKLDEDHIANFRLLQKGFHHACVHKEIPVNLLVKDEFLDHLDFLRWFHKFFMLNRSAAAANYDEWAASILL